MRKQCASGRPPLKRIFAKMILVPFLESAINPDRVLTKMGGEASAPSAHIVEHVQPSIE